MNANLIKMTYRRLAPLYDSIFGAVLQPGRRRTVQTLRCQAGQRILEVGVGTGLSLALYPDTVNVVGIDICPDMLQRARARVQNLGLDNVQALLPMDARHMAFPSGSFDKVVAMYVIPALDDPQELVREMRRVCKPEGELVFVNHFHSRQTVIHSVERLLTPLWRLVNYRSDLSLEDFIQDSQLEVVETQSTNIFNYATMVRCKNHIRREIITDFNGEYASELLAEEA